MDALSKEILKNYLEAMGFLIKLHNKLKYEDVPDKENHLSETGRFIERNNLYKQFWEAKANE